MRGLGRKAAFTLRTHAARRGGLWIPVVLNWMTHVYPNEQQKWAGMNMDMEAGAPDSGAAP